MAKANSTTLPEGADFALRGHLCIGVFRETVLTEHEANDGFSYSLCGEISDQINEYLAAIELLITNNNVRRRPTRFQVVSGGKA